MQLFEDYKNTSKIVEICVKPSFRTNLTLLFFICFISTTLAAEFNKSLPTLSIAYKKFKDEEILDVDQYGHDIYIENSSGVIHEETFLDVPRILRFMVYNCRFASFDWTSLFRMSYLESIDLYDVRGLPVLTNSVMLGFKSLKSMSIYDSDVTFQHDTFRRLKQLEYLSISKVDVTILGNEVFTGSRLRELYWTESGITKIDKNCLSTLKNVRIINLSGNKIEYLQPETFVGLKNLERLYLNRNRLATVNFRHFASLSSLTYLDVSKNRIPTVDVEEVWRSVPSLTRIIMDSRSAPTGLKKDAFDSLQVMLI
ncbi:protein phosphatase 1 regulatory subunit SDS22-like [Coccinella septempunctata]|uniref:protein phosphatase 1 regulatory subunit SDS22-like n=1 Tax=Coccinella septempunctata TaxID=41139 RepID=UPI001D095750|nr:protein phosphatase 1 regulatory subunit SDS22-like [Coccinella septempunctata]